MPSQWEFTNSIGQKPSHRWGHSSCVLPTNQLIIYGGYADSLFLNDLWMYKPNKNMWFKLTTPVYNQIPSQRSNCSFVYCKARQSILIFGGGASQSKRNNDMWQLKIQQKQENQQLTAIWQQLEPVSSQIPWGRTYHITQQYENYLIIQGGETCLGQVEDLWAFQIQSLRWVQLKCVNKIQARKFHSSAIIQNKLYLIGGIYGDYQALNQILYVDINKLKLSELKQIQQYSFQWKNLEIKSSEPISLGRWGHVSKVFQQNIIIFGGRTASDQNDLLVLNPITLNLQKINTQKCPEGRRKPSAQLIGSYFIINCGYNGKYLSDLCWINLRFKAKQSMISTSTLLTVTKSISSKQICDIHINTKDNKYVNLYSKFIRNSFESQDYMIGFLQQLGQMTYCKAMKYVDVLNYGVINKGENNLKRRKFNIQKQKTTDSIISRLFGEQQQQNNYLPNHNNLSFQFNTKQLGLKQQQQPQEVDESILKKYKITYSTNELLANKKRILFNVIKQNLVMNLNPNKPIRVDEKQFQRIYNQIDTDPTCDTRIFVKYLDNQNGLNKQNKEFNMSCCKEPLILRSEYFKNIFQYDKQLRQTKNKLHQISLNLQRNSAKIILLFCYYGHLIIPNNFSLSECVRLYKDAQKYSINQIMHISFQQIKSFLFSSLLRQQIEVEFKKFYNKINSTSFNPENKKIKLSSNVKSQNDFISQEFNQIIEFCFLQASFKINKQNQLKGNDRWAEIFSFFINKISQLSIQKILVSKKQQKVNWKNEIGSKKKIFQAKIKSSKSQQDKQNMNISVNNRSNISQQFNNKNSSIKVNKITKQKQRSHYSIQFSQYKNPFQNTRQWKQNHGQEHSQGNLSIKYQQKSPQFIHNNNKSAPVNNFSSQANQYNISSKKIQQFLLTSQSVLTFIDLISIMLHVHIVYPLFFNNKNMNGNKKYSTHIDQQLKQNLYNLIQKNMVQNGCPQNFVNKMKRNVLILEKVFEKQYKTNILKYDYLKSLYERLD